MSVRPIGMTRDKLLESNDGLCWRCLMKEAQHLHHVVPRKQGWIRSLGKPLAAMSEMPLLRSIIGWRENGAGTHTMSRYNCSSHPPLAEWIKINHAEVEDGRSPQIDLTELRISGLNHRKSKRIDPDEPMFRIYFWLSAEPNTSWRKLFELVRRESSHSLRAKARVDGRNIVIECPLSEIEAQKAELDADVANANYEYSRCGGLLANWRLRETGAGERRSPACSGRLGASWGYGDQG